jgi:diketogulonate reductase-like aldo/keto reductase
VAAYQTLEKLVDEGKVVGIGLSNYTIEDYEELRPHIRIPPLVNQLEVNPFLYREKTLNYFTNEGILIQAYRALRQASGFDVDILVELSKKYEKTPAQILGRWCVQKNYIHLPKSSFKERMKENLDIFDFSLTDQELKRLETLTTDENKKAMEVLYRKGLVRDTPLTEDAVRPVITLD